MNPSDQTNEAATAILLAAGRSTRMRQATEDKILTEAGGIPVICHSLKAFVESGVVDRFTVIYRDEAQRSRLEAACEGKTGGLPVDWVQGGDERQDSVARALEAQPAACRRVFIHDCARPLIEGRAIQALDEAVRRDQAAVLAHPPADTVKRVPLGEDLRRADLEDLDRSRLWMMETPQAFAFPLISKAYAQVIDKGMRITDDTAAVSLLGHPVTIVPNPQPNPKITGPADLDRIDWLLRRRGK